MSTHARIDRICAIVLAVTLVITVLFMNGEALGMQNAARTLGYETRLFDPGRVHTIELVMDDWDGFIETCQSEEYSPCTVLIDNEAYKDVGIRGKGNTSLTTVSTMDSQRYSFKIEFDHYDGAGSYHGLDKLSLNNIIQDNTYMKDYLTYRLMDEFGVDAPLCSFVWITVNGEDWGLYLAVEGVEDSFLRRNYGRNAGELYKPDSMSFGGGGPGNGRNFHMSDFLNTEDGEDSEQTEQFPFPGGPPNFGGGMPEFGGGMPDFGGEMPNFNGEMPEFSAGSDSAGSDGGESGGSRRGGRPDFNGAFGGMGSTDVKLQYIDDSPESYANIFDNAKTDLSDGDKTRLIAALKNLSQRTDLEDTVDVDEVIRYFVVHNYVCNGDSYTGSIIHNYYLHEKDGQLSMIPWDYNLAFGTFQSNDASGMVNDPIDTPMSVSDPTDRPMFGWIVEDEDYLARYHETFAEFLDTVDVTGMIDDAYEKIAPYVEKDPTAFCTQEEFEAGAAALRDFCQLRTLSIRGQLDGRIPTTEEGQNADSGSLVDASGLNLSDMGSMGRGGGNGGFGGQSSGSDGGGRFGGNRGGGGFGGRNFGNRETMSSDSGKVEIPAMSQAFPIFRGGSDSSSDGFRPDFLSFSNPEQDSGTVSRETWTLLGGSAGILLIGILIAYKTKRH